MRTKFGYMTFKEALKEFSNWARDTMGTIYCIYTRYSILDAII